MAYTDEFRELIEGVQDAINALLDASTHTSFMRCRVALVELDIALRQDARAYVSFREGEERNGDSEEPTEHQTKQRNSARNWRTTTHAERLHWVLNAIGDERLTLRELVGVMRRQHPDTDIYETYVNPLLKELVAGGDLKRLPTGGRGSQPKWRYARTGLSEEMRAIERAFGDDETVA